MITQTTLLSFILALTHVTLSQLQPTFHPRAVSSTAKAGLAWPNGQYENMKQYATTGKVQWYYTWSPSGFQSSLEFVPMLWGDRQVDDWSHNIDSTIGNLGVTHVLGFNEPQEWTQSNMTPAHGAELWKQYLEPLKQRGVYLGSPAPSSAPSGKEWLLDWLDACQGGCTVDFIAMHWYDINSTAFIQYLEDFHNTFQRPIWVTEWACQNFNDASAQCSPQDIINFMNATQQFMDTTDWVGRYSWFGAFKDLQGVNQDDALMDMSGHITTLGQQYIGAVTPNVSADYQPGVVHGGNGNAGKPSLGGAASTPFHASLMYCIIALSWVLS